MRCACGQLAESLVLALDRHVGSGLTVSLIAAGILKDE